MKITRRSILTKEIHIRDMPAVTQERLDEWRPKGKPGKPIQEVFHDLSADDREFLLSGTTPEERVDFLFDKKKKKGHR